MLVVILSADTDLVVLNDESSTFFNIKSDYCEIFDLFIQYRPKRCPWGHRPPDGPHAPPTAFNGPNWLRTIMDFFIEKSKKISFYKYFLILDYLNYGIYSSIKYVVYAF